MALSTYYIGQIVEKARRVLSCLSLVVEDDVDNSGYSPLKEPSERLYATFKAVEFGLDLEKADDEFYALVGVLNNLTEDFSVPCEGEINPNFIDVHFPDQGLSFCFPPQILSPSLDISKVVKVSIGGGLIALTNVLDTYTNEPFTFRQLPPSGTYVADGVITILIHGNYYRREYTGYANVLWWGAKPDGVTNSTAPIQNSWDSGLDIYAPGLGVGKEYRATHLVLKDRTKWHGSGTSETILKPLPTSEPNFITIADGPVTHVKFSDTLILGLDNTANIGQNGFRAEARVALGNPTGGLWWSTFERVFIFDFDGDAIQLIGNGAGFLPIQIDYFELCEFHSGTSATSRAMMQDGQIEQIQWTRCAWSGKDGAHPNNMGIMFQSTTRQLGSGGGAQTFSQCYLGNVLQGMETHFSVNMKWLGTYFENCVNGVADFYELTAGMWFDGSSFQACGVNDAHNGFLFRSDFSSSFHPGSSHLFTQPDNVISGANQGFHETGTYYGFNLLTSKFEGEYQDIEITLADGETNPTNGRIKLIATRNGLNGTDHTTLKWIDSPVGPGKEFIIQSNFGFDMQAGGNLFLLSPIRVFKNDSIVVKRIDNFYHVIAYIPFLQDHAAASVSQFGALGAPSDDTAAFQAAHDYVASRGAGTVIIPSISQGYNISNLVVSPFVVFEGHNNVVLNPITSAHTELITMLGIPVIPHHGFRVEPNPSNPGQSIYNFTYTQNAASSATVDFSYITDFNIQPTSTDIANIATAIPAHGNKLRMRIRDLSFDDYVRIVGSGNIGVPETFGSGIVLRNGDVVEMTLRDNPDKITFTYLVTGLVRSNLSLPSLPSSGQWLQGEKIYNSVPTIGGNEGWVCTESGNYATTPPTWITFGSYTSSPVAPVPITREIPVGTIDGVNTIFTLSHEPLLDSESVYRNGQLQDDAGNDYTISGEVITFTIAPISGDKIRVSYIY